MGSPADSRCDSPMAMGRGDGPSARPGPTSVADDDSSRGDRLPCGHFMRSWTADAESPTGRRYALDESCITYGFNARCANSPAQGGLTAGGRQDTDFETPAARGAGRLPFASLESRAVRRAFQNSAEVIAGPKATRAEIIAALGGALVRAFRLPRDCRSRSTTQERFAYGRRGSERQGPTEPQALRGAIGNAFGL